MNKDHILFLMGRIIYKINRFIMKELKEHGVTGLAPSHGEILGSLMLRGSLQMSELAEIIDKDKSTITALTNKLLKLGYIKKATDRDDKRISIISLSKKGKVLIPDFMEISEKLRYMAYNGLSEKDKQLLFDLLSVINGNL